jgi:6-phosphofructokinase 1
MFLLPELAPVKSLKRIAVLTSGGDAPGMNAAIRAVVRAAQTKKIEVYGINRGYTGLIKGDYQLMAPTSVNNILQRGGTILKSSRCKEFLTAEIRQKAAQALLDQGIEGLVVIGGNGSLTGAYLLSQETSLAVVGIPGTIDNDVYGTDDAIGFDSAVNTALEAIDRIRDTAHSHERVFLVEVMGRNTGFIAAEVGIAGGAEMVILPGQKFSLEEMGKRLTRSHKQGKESIIVVAEGNKPGLSNHIASGLKQRGFSARVCILGHTQRGGSPTGHDRVLAFSLGFMSVNYLLAGYNGVMACVQDNQIKAMSLAGIDDQQKVMPESNLHLIEALTR